MCGIAAISIGRRARKNIPYQTLRNLTRELMLEIEERGVDASGIAVINEGKDAVSQVFKKPLRADRFVIRPRFDDMLDQINDSTNFIMLHTRAASVGGNYNNFNNHPIVVQPIVGIHNGTLFNDLQLFRRFSKHFSSEGQVDSEIIFKLYLHYVGTGAAPTEAMQKVGELLHGAFTGALVDMRKPHQMIMFKHERALCLISIPHYDVIIAVSEAKFYDRARSRLKIKAADRCELLKDGTGVMIDLNLPQRITADIQDFEISIPHMHRSRHSHWLHSVYS